MSRTLLRPTIAACALLAPSVAHADSLMPASEEGAEEGELAFRRSGFAAGVGLGVSGFFGGGDLGDLREGGASLSLRLGTSASASMLWFLQLDLASYEKDRGASLLGIGAHYYLQEKLWVRGSLALANSVDQDAAGERITNGGLALIGGIGRDIYTRGIFALDVEASASLASFEDASLGLLVVQVVANWY